MATKQDLELLEHRLRSKIQSTIAVQTRTIVFTVVFALVGAVLTTASLTLAIAQLG